MYTQEGSFWRLTNDDVEYDDDLVFYIPFNILFKSSQDDGW